MISRKLIKKQPGRRWLTYAAGLGLLALTFGIAGAALAVHDLAFQLDGDVTASTTTSVGGHTQGTDWDTLFDSAGAKKALPAGFDASVFHKDFNNVGTTFSTNDSSTFATGSKDTLPITPGWQCNRDANVNSKIDIMNAYSAAYTDDRGTVTTTDDHDILYFALERNANTGDGNVGFWFLQDGNVACDSPGGNLAFTGAHQTNDLLIVSAFTNGGAVSTIDVYRWVGGASGGLDPSPIAHGVDCKSTGGGDTACATVNTGTIGTPWLTSNKQDGVGHSLRISEFFEGGLDLTDAGITGACFNTFMGVTRSSQSLTATLFDYALGQLGECTSTTVTDPVENDGTTPLPAPPAGVAIPGDPNDAKIDVKDKATITVGGADTWTGSLTFHLCGPTAAEATTLCTSGGVAIGSAQTVTANGNYTSATATVTAAGRYCWRANFASGTTGVPDSSDSRASECFIVTPRTPTVVTDAGPVGSDDPAVAFGQPVTDTAVLSNTAHQPGAGGPAGSDGSINPATLGGDADGTIKFTLYKDSTCTTQATGTGSNPQTVTVSGNGTYGPVSFTPDAPGTYYWVAEYDGDLPNTLAASDTACDSADEKVVVQQISTNVITKQSWIPNDTVKVSAASGNLGANGSVLFELFAGATCGGSAAYSETVGIAGGAATETVSTSNSTFVITTNFADPAASSTGQYSWRVTYTPNAADTAHTGSSSSCAAENFTTTYTNDNS